MLDVSKQSECSDAVPSGRSTGSSWGGSLWESNGVQMLGRRRGKVFSSSSCSLFCFLLFLFLFGLHALLSFFVFLFSVLFIFCFRPNLIDNFDSVTYGLNSNVI